MIVVSRRFSVFYRHARDLVSPLINDHHRIPIPAVVLSNLPCNTGSVSLSIFGTRERFGPQGPFPPHP